MALFEELIKKYDSLSLNTKNTDIIEFNMNTQIEISQMFENLSEDRSWSFEELTRKDTSYATHGFHKYPAKFIPQLARRCIEEYTKEEDVVCDPFMGCGTTLVEALVSGRKAIGTDINAVAWLITNTKSRS